MEAISQETLERNTATIRSMEDYFVLRRHTVALRIFISIISIHDLVLDHILGHPHVKRLEDLVIDLAIIGNVVPLPEFSFEHFADFGD